MKTNEEGTSGSGTVPEGETGVGEIVEIKIKTLDSQSYTVRVEKKVAVLALKEQLVSVVGVPVESQRLICRGKVLKDDQLLSAYNVEDGHTLHLVARQPPSTSGVGPSSASSEGGQEETGTPPAGGRPGHISHSLLMGTINFPDSGEGQLPDLNRIINAVMSSMGMHGGGSLQGGTGNADNSISRVSATAGGLDEGPADGRNSGNDQDSGVRELELQIDALYGMPSNSTDNAGQSPIRGIQVPAVVPDALTTMSQYLDRLEQSFAAEELARTTNSQESSPTEVRVATDVQPIREEPRRGASPAALGALVNRVNNLLRGQAGSALSRLASQLGSEPSMLDGAARLGVQHAALHDGNLMQQIGALLLELGRATLSLRMGQSPSESGVNSGPAIFISPSGPNPMMVQGASFAPFRHGFDLSHVHHHHIALPRHSGGAVITGLPPMPAGGTGFTVRQLIERADPRNAPPAGSAPNDAGGPARANNSNVDAADGANTGPSNLPSGPTGMQGAFMTFDENGAVRVVPVRSRSGVHPPSGHLHDDDALIRGFQRFRAASNPPNDTPASAAMYPPPPAYSDSPRQMDQANGSSPGEGGGAVSGSGNGEVSNLMSSLAPLLQHIAGSLQQSGTPTASQQQHSNPEPQQPPSTDIVEQPTEAEVRPTDCGQANGKSPNEESTEPASDTGLMSMVVDDSSGVHGSSDLGSHATLQGQTLEASRSDGANEIAFDTSITAPAGLGLGLGDLQSPPARVRRRRQTQQSSQDGQRQPVQETAQNLGAQRDVANDTNPRTNASPLGQFVRAIGVEGQQGGGGIIGHLMRSPVVENLVQQVMQGVGDVDGGGAARRGPASGGLDLSSMLQHVVPVVTQMLNGGSTAAFPGTTVGARARTSSDGAAGTTASREVESERWQDALSPEEVAGWSEIIATDEALQQSMPPQRPLSDVYRRGTPAAKRQKTAVESAAEKLEDGGSAEGALRDLANAAGAGIPGNNGTSSTEESSAQQVVRVDGLAEVYLVVLFNDLVARVAADADFGDGSRFPNAARIFRQPSQTPSGPDGERR